jgi:hypothetical protein
MAERAISVQMTISAIVRMPDIMTGFILVVSSDVTWRIPCRIGKQVRVVKSDDRQPARAARIAA